MIDFMPSEIVGRDAELAQIHTFLDRPTNGIRALADRDEQARADCHWYLAVTEAAAGDLLLAADHADAAREIHRQYGVELAPHLLPSAMIALRRGTFDEARVLSRRALELAGGQPLMSHLAVLATAATWTGNLSEPLELYRQAEAAGDAREILEPGLREGRPEFVEALVLAGGLDEAARLQDDWEDGVRRLDRDGLMAAATRCRGLLAAANGDLGAAESLLVTASTLAQGYSGAGPLYLS
jgi:Flp pilus assembly protein TadD